MPVDSQEALLLALTTAVSCVAVLLLILGALALMT